MSQIKAQMTIKVEMTFTAGPRDACETTMKAGDTCQTTIKAGPRGPGPAVTSLLVSLGLSVPCTNAP